MLFLSFSLSGWLTITSCGEGLGLCTSKAICGSFVSMFSRFVGVCAVGGLWFFARESVGGLRGTAAIH